MIDPYATLGVDRGAALAEIRRAYRRLVKRHHPDVNPDPKATETIQGINAAFERIEEERARPKKHRSSEERPRRPEPPAGFAWGGCEVVGRTGRVRRTWGFVERVHRQGAGLYNVHLSTRAAVQSASIDIEGFVRAQMDYQAEDLVRISIFSRVGLQSHQDADFVLNLGVRA